MIIPTTLLIIIGYKNQTFIHKALGSIYLKQIGLWSFSIYLIHWVILAFYKYINGLFISLTAGLVILIVSVLLGGLSYYFIEQIFRFKRWNIAIAILIFIAIPFAITQTNYYFAKSGGVKYANITPKWPIDEYTCHQSSKEYASDENDLFRANCIYNAKAEPNIILWGDSNAYHYIPALKQIAKKLGFGFRNMAHIACSSLTIFKKENYILGDVKGACDYNSAKAYKLAQNYDVVILSSSWFNVYNKVGGDILRKELDKTLNDLSKTANLILFFGNIPIPDNLDLNNILTSSKINNNKNNINVKNNTISFSANKIVKETVMKYSKAYYIDFNNLLCDDVSCKYKEDSNSLYMHDGSNLSTYGSNYIGEHYINSNINDVFYKIKKLYKENSKDTFTKNVDKILTK